MSRAVPSLRTLLIVLAAALAGAAATWLALGGRGAGSDPSPRIEGAEARYQCPMHPAIVSDRPGDCPVCGMRLVPVEEGARPAAPSGGAAPRTTTIWRSTMNPGETSDHPGPDSMGMAMVPEEIEAGAPVPGIEGRAAVRVPEMKRQLIGVRTAPVTTETLARTIRAVGRVAYDETRLHHVHTKVGGWVEALHANATGELVRAGDPLLTVYSPELLASAEEYLLALRARERLSEAALPAVLGSGEDLLASARRRLLLFDLTPGQIDAIGRAGEAPRTTTLHAPVTGHIVERRVTQGEKIEPGMNLLDIADLSRVWVLADVYEHELPFVKVGQEATLTLSYLPGRTFEGRIRLVYPVLTEATRTVKVRLEFANPDLALKPEMFGDVTIRAEMGRGVVVPESAVLSSGRREIVFVERGEGWFEPREIRIGVRLADRYEVLEGLRDGERVLVSGNFLVDSESRLKAALAEAGAAPSPGGGAPAAPPAGPPEHRHPGGSAP